jgi:hypothetical protein
LAFRGIAPGDSDNASVGAATLTACPDEVADWVPAVHMGPEETAAVSIADADGDGLQDVIFTNQRAESLSIWWGQRGMMPTDRTDVHVGRSTSAARVGDVDGDGKTEIVVALPDVAAFGILRASEEARRFRDVEHIFQGPAPLFPVLLDFNQDGRSDVVFAEALELGRSAYARVANGSGWDPHVMLGASLGVPLLAIDEKSLITVQSKRLAQVDLDASAQVASRVDLGFTHDWTPVATMKRDVVLSGPAGELVRANGPRGGPCRLGVLPVGFGRWGAAADLDGDGTLDAVALDSCRSCTSNHVFARGLPARADAASTDTP